MDDLVALARRQQAAKPRLRAHLLRLPPAPPTQGHILPRRGHGRGGPAQPDFVNRLLTHVEAIGLTEGNAPEVIRDDTPQLLERFLVGGNCRPQPWYRQRCRPQA